MGLTGMVKCSEGSMCLVKEVGYFASTTYYSKLFIDSSKKCIVFFYVFQGGICLEHGMLH